MSTIEVGVQTSATPFPVPAETIIKIVGQHSCAGVTQNWPLLEQALQDAGIYSEACAQAMIATVAVETWYRFEPIREVGSPEYFTKHYEGRVNLGNTQPGDGARFFGRGFIQITGRYNYERYGRLLGVDLAGNAELALDPAIAAKIAVQFFVDRHLAAHADAGQWEIVRHCVNGGTNGLEEFLRIVHRLSDALSMVTNL